MVPLGSRRPNEHESSFHRTYPVEDYKDDKTTYERVIMTTSNEVRNQIVSLVRDFVKRDVEPVATEYDRDDIYPAELVDKMAEMGLFGINIPEEYGGLGLDYTTF